MPYTSHGHWFGADAPTAEDVQPRLVARCGGPAMCPICAHDAAPVVEKRTVTRRRYATRAELAEPMAAHMRGANDMDVSWEDLALAALEGLAELHVPVDALVKITVEEEA
ncbi:hypothetical protein [Amycolatopsis plumensis]|uniref:Uncharacterized protein n=1 Tax=Amycolatopsis plumensis TaxID=236508 RepID=A0ABV5UCK9_9PSEU